MPRQARSVTGAANTLPPGTSAQVAGQAGGVASGVGVQPAPVLQCATRGWPAESAPTSQASSAASALTARSWPGGAATVDQAVPFQCNSPPGPAAHTSF